MTSLSAVLEGKQNSCGNFQWVCYRDTNLRPYYLYMTCWNWQNVVEVMACCLRASGPQVVHGCTLQWRGVIMNLVTSQITSISIVCASIYSGTDQRKHQSSALLDFVRRIYRWSVNSPHKGPVTRKMFPFDDVIMTFVDCSWVIYKDALWHQPGFPGNAK